MKTLKYITLSLLGLSLAGFIWLGWFLLTTPASSFATQGPGLPGALVMAGSQIPGAIGLLLLTAWQTALLWLGRKKVANKIDRH